MEVVPLGLGGVLAIRPQKFGDARGFFSETYNAERFAAAGVPLTFVQDNHSFSAAKGVVRGLHYQLPPRAQDKLVRVAKGAILDVAVDIRKSSPTFGQWVSLVVSAAEWNQILVPKGFAHGFVTLEENTEVIYKVTDYYSPEHDRSIRFDDPDIGIEWPFSSSAVQLSDKDKMARTLAESDVFE
ncbi:dTDP-4-dehydrorhamnose 3,5-epimerase [Rhizobium sp. IBUN]|uniref:dTDP-4-dehydrorhamnose 3,5-epimerase n=1 Tax=Rhizobium sp. IBUN TaxID=1042326 RepID=UPI0003FD8A01|nr:dTDP-4-dehydrorhamnose 3,5-epimerase [Rhizobium sp. IBUN]